MPDFEVPRITYIGTQVATLLFGISLVQSWIFFKECERDPLHLKITAFVILVIGLLHIMSVSALCYGFLFSTQDTHTLLLIRWASRLSSLLTSPVVSIIQWAYGFRIYRLTRNMALLAAILFLGLATLALNAAAVGVDFGRQMGSSKMGKSLASAACVIAMVCDAIIASTMLYSLRIQKTGVKSTQRVLNTLSYYALASGTLTFFMSCCLLGTYLALPDPAYPSAAIAFALPHLYAISFLALLNSRRYLRERYTPAASTTSDLQAAPTMPKFMALHGSILHLDSEVTMQEECHSFATVASSDTTVPEFTALRDLRGIHSVEEKAVEEWPVHPSRQASPIISL